MTHNVTIVGNPDDGFTTAEISDGNGTYLGRVFELVDGWYVQLDEPERLRDGDLVETIVEARTALLHYVNRKGAQFPEEWTVAAISLWLMQRDDGKGFTIKPENENG